MNKIIKILKAHEFQMRNIERAIKNMSDTEQEEYQEQEEERELQERINNEPSEGYSEL